ncbi:hypothetical protein ACFOEK_14630 [Litoribrevibacter euphylliae]|uniref:Uncharacterized protein n=1 Tax=Litoribrevibacter euphylliae TaxID=1834034 RepID=A0ABV7HEI3_9GAMM
MATLKGPTEGGNGGKRGHSNMEHRDETEIIKAASNVRRRNNEKQEIRRELENIASDS